MQQRQLRLGDILDDYCPRERRLTNHAVVAMVGADVKQTRCTTCDTEHDYKHAKVPRQRKKVDGAALQGAAAASAPKKVAHAAETTPEDAQKPPIVAPAAAVAVNTAVSPSAQEVDEHDEHVDQERADNDDDERDGNAEPVEDGPVHRPLIR